MLGHAIRAALSSSQSYAVLPGSRMVERASNPLNLTT